MPRRRPSRLLLWRLPAAVALAAAGVFAAGAVLGLTRRLGEPLGEGPAPTPAPPAPIAAGGTLRIVALGDSLTRGAGDDGKGGYPARVAQALQRSGRAATVVNLAVDGSETADLLRRLDDPEVARQVTAAGLILVSIGGNDLTHALPGEGDVAGAAAALVKARDRFGRILARIRALNASAPVRVVGLYDPAAGQSPERALVRRTLLAWNGALEEATLDLDGVVVVPVADLFEGRPDRISSDRFHPGPAGYDEIGARVAAALPLKPSPAGT